MKKYNMNENKTTTTTTGKRGRKPNAVKAAKDASASNIKIIFNATRLTGEAFKRWVHTALAGATVSGSGKDGAAILRNIYDELMDNEDLDTMAKMRLLYYGRKNKMDYLANYQPDELSMYDYVQLKAEFVRLLLERQGAFAR